MTARTKVVFHTTPDDGREMAHLFPAQQATVSPDDLDTKPIDYLMDHGSEDFHVRTFIETYLRPMLSYKRGNKVDIAKDQWKIKPTAAALWGVQAGVGKGPVYVSDPTPT